jgi:hypothetical protein
MPTIVQGTLGVNDVNTGKQVRDVTKGLYHKYQNINPLTAVMAKMPKGKATVNPKKEYTRKDLLPRWDTVSVGAAAGSTLSLTVSNGLYFKAGDVVEFPQVSPSATQTSVGRLTAVNTTTGVIAVSPVGWQSNLATTVATFPAVSAGMYIHILHDASEEYSQRPTMKVTKVEQEWNYITFPRAPFIIGNIEKDILQYTGDERAERREETHRDIRIQMEQALFHGERYYVDGTDGRQFFCRGFKNYIKQGAGVNILNWASGLTEAEWDEFLLKGPCQASIGGPSRFGFFSNDLYLKILEIGKAKQRIVSTPNILGMSFDTYLAPGGIKIHMMVHHLLTNAYEGAGLIIDPTRARLVPYRRNPVLAYHTELQENDRAGVSDEWRGLFTLEVDRIEPHAWISK